MATKKVIAAEIQIDGKQSQQTVGLLKELIAGMKDELVKVTQEFGDQSEEVKVTKQAISELEGNVNKYADAAFKGFTKTDGAVKNIKTELKNARLELVAAQEQFGDYSREAIEAAKKVAGLNDQIKEAAETADLFDPGKKFQAFAGALQATAAGFQVVTSAQALFGVESEAVEKTLLKVQAAMALSQGLSAVTDSIKDFKRLGAIIQSTTLFQKANNAATVIAATVQRAFGASVVGTGRAFNILKGAIIATGIGALIVLLGEAVAAFERYTSAADEAAEAQKDFNDKVTESANLRLKGETASLERSQRLEVARAKAAGANEEAIFQIEQKYRRLKIGALQSYYERIKSTDELAAEAAKSAINDLNTEGQVAALDNEKRLSDIRKAAAEKANAERLKAAKEYADAKKKFDKNVSQSNLDAIKDEAKLIEEEENRRAAAEIERLKRNEQNRLTTKQALAELALLNDPDSIDNKIAKINADLELELSTLAEGDIRRQVLAKKAANDIVQIEKEAKDAKVKIANEEAEQKERLMQAVGNGLTALSDIVGRETAVGKALAVSASLINTYSAIAGQLRAFAGVPVPGYAIAQAIATGLVGFASVKNILKTKVPGSSSGGGSAPSGLGLSASAPLQPQTQFTRIDQTSINQIGNAAGRAYVLETDVTNNQERTRRLNRAARIN